MAQAASAGWGGSSTDDAGIGAAWAEDVADKVSPDRCAVVNNIPPDVDEGDLVEFFNGAVVAVTENRVDAFADAAPCFDCRFSADRSSALLAFRTASAATVAVGLAGIELRGVPLPVWRPQGYRCDGRDPVCTLVFHDMTPQRLTGRTSAAEGGAGGVAQGRLCGGHHRWYERRRHVRLLVPRTPGPSSTRATDDRTPHEVLGVSPTTSPTDIRQAYLARCRACHPDNLAAQPDVEEYVRVVRAYATIRRGGVDRSARLPRWVRKAYDGDMKHDPRAAAFLLRQLLASTSVVVQRLQVEQRYAAALARAQGQMKESSCADLLVLRPQSEKNEHTEVLVAGKPGAAAQVGYMISKYISEIGSLQVPPDGVIVRVPPEVLEEHAGRPYLEPRDAARIWQANHTSVHCVDDRVVVRGPRIPPAVAMLQGILNWRGVVILPDHRELDAWSYAAVVEMATGMPDPQLVPSKEPDLAAVRRVLCLAKSRGASRPDDAGAEKLPQLAAAVFQETATGGLRMSHAVLRVAVSAAAFGEVKMQPFEMQALYICGLLRLWIGRSVQLPLEGFSRHPLYTAVTELRALLLDPHFGFSMRARGYAAVRDAIPEAHRWQSWEESLKADSKVVCFLREVFAWLRERRPSLGLLPAQWAEIPGIASIVMWICVGESVIVDLVNGLRRTDEVPSGPPPGADVAPGLPASDRGDLDRRPWGGTPERSPERAQRRSKSASRPRRRGGGRREKKERKREEARKPAKKDSRREKSRARSEARPGLPGRKEEAEQVAHVVDLLLRMAPSSSDPLPLQKVLHELKTHGGRALDAAKAGRQWFEARPDFFVVSAYRDGAPVSSSSSGSRHGRDHAADVEHRVQLTAEIRAEARTRLQEQHEQSNEDRRSSLLADAEVRLKELRGAVGGLGQATPPAREAAALLCVLARDPAKARHGLAVELTRSFRSSTAKQAMTAKELHRELVPFPPAVVMRAIVAIDEVREESWDVKALGQLLQSAALDMHQYAEWPRATLATTALSLRNASCPPLTHCIGLDECLLVSAAALRLEVELSEEVVLLPTSALFCPFAQTCAWLASIFCTSIIPEAHRRDVTKAFKKLSTACQGLHDKSVQQVYDAEGLCRLGQAIALFLQGCTDPDGCHAVGISALESIAKGFMSHPADRAVVWSPEQLTILADACSVIDCGRAEVFRHIAAIAEQHSRSSVTWDSEQLWRLLRLAESLRLLGTMESLLSSLYENGALLRYVLRASIRDMPLLFSISVLLKRPSVLLGFAGRCNEDNLQELSVSELVAVLQAWPTEDEDWKMLDQVRAVLVTAAVLQTESACCYDVSFSDAHALLQAAADMPAAPALLRVLGVSCGMLIAAPEPAPLASMREEVASLARPFIAHNAKAPRLASACAARLLRSMADAVASDLPAILAATQELAALGGLRRRPAVVAAIAGLPAVLDAAAGGGTAQANLLDLLELLLHEATFTALPEVFDTHLAEWVERVEETALALSAYEAEDGISLYNVLAEKGETGDSERDAPLEAARAALGPLWLEVLLTRSTMLTGTYCGGAGPGVARLAPDPVMATQRLAEAIAGIPEGKRSALQEVESGLSWPPALLVHVQRYGELMETVGGTFTVCGESHGRPMFKRTAPLTDDSVFLYYWSEGSDPGWWFGPEPGGDAAWVYKLDGEDGASEEPPRSGWNVVADTDGLASVTVLRCDALALAAAEDEAVEYDDSAGTWVGRGAAGAAGAAGAGSDSEDDDDDVLLAAARRGLESAAAGGRADGGCAGVAPEAEDPALRAPSVGLRTAATAAAPSSRLGGPHGQAEQAAAAGATAARGGAIGEADLPEPGAFVCSEDEEDDPLLAAADAALRGGSRIDVEADAEEASAGKAADGAGAEEAPASLDGGSGAGCAKWMANEAEDFEVDYGEALDEPEPEARPEFASEAAAAGSASDPLREVAERLKRRRDESLDQRQTALKAWLLGLDDGAGGMLQYYDVLATEFEADLAQIAAVRCGGKDGSGLLSQVDPVFWDTVAVRKMGHRMLFARGISQLS